MSQDVVIPTANNASFVVGAIENLSGSDALIALRGRGIKERPFTLVEDLQRSAEQKFRTKEEALEGKLKTAQNELQKIQSSGEGGNGVILTEKNRKPSRNSVAKCSIPAASFARSSWRSAKTSTISTVG